MDFDPSLQKDEALWKAYAPSKIEERDGDIVVTIPYQKQLHQEDMAPDNNAPRQSYELVIRAYEPNIVRVFTTMADDAMMEADDMLQFSPDIKRLSLRYVYGDVIANNGNKVATRPSCAAVGQVERPASRTSTRPLHHLLSRW